MIRQGLQSVFLPKVGGTSIIFAILQKSKLSPREVYSSSGSGCNHRYHHHLFPVKMVPTKMTPYIQQNIDLQCLKDP